MKRGGSLERLTFFKGDGAPGGPGGRGRMSVDAVSIVPVIAGGTP